jgi:hypothetical protein
MRKELTSIPGHPLYNVTKDGEVWAKPRGVYLKDKLGRRTFHGHNGKWLKPGLNCCGYLTVNLYDNPGTGQHSSHLIQHLVLETFVSPKPERKECRQECRHLNGIRTDNRIENLCWGTRSENQQDSLRHETHGGLGRYGEKHPNSKLSDYDRRMILYSYGTRLFTRKNLAEIYHVSEALIKKLVGGCIYPFVKILKPGGKMPK